MFIRLSQQEMLVANELFTVYRVSIVSARATQWITVT